MKSPAELRVALRRQWENAALRKARLLDARRAWPVVVPIGRPSPSLIASNLDRIKRHVETWRDVNVGEVLWEPIQYRATSSPVDIPTHWRLLKPSDWTAACADALMRHEFDALSTLVEETDPFFHSLLVRRRSLWRGQSLEAIVQAARLAQKLAPGCADGRPLRALSMEGIDTKFFERHERLLTVLLDTRFEGEASRLGLEAFLGAAGNSDHWLLVLDLDGSLLPFTRQRVPTAELCQKRLPGSRLILVENESCQHHLPAVADAIAVLGAGFNLAWAEAYRNAGKQIAYWGDVDTWGLQFLATARQTMGRLDPLMMSVETYVQFQQFAVAEPVVASHEPPTGLTSAEQRLYQRLLHEPRGRLEQEFLPVDYVQQNLKKWAVHERGSGDLRDSDRDRPITNQ